MRRKKALLAGLNASYSHTSLSVYSLARIPVDADVIVREFTINEDIHAIYRALMEARADIILFSCYLWNIDLVLRLSRMIKTVRPDCRIVLGGPEVSFDCAAWLRDNTCVDGILTGEGEAAFPLLFTEEPHAIPGFWYRDGDKIKAPGQPAIVPDLSELPPVYADFSFQPNKIYYLEASRGCPYHCAFCLSSTQKVRTVSMEQVKQELTALIDAEVMLVKFVDRTMNADSGRLREILAFLSAHDRGKTVFHMEIHPAALSSSDLSSIGKLREGLVQFEIGIQSTHPATCRAIHRVGDPERITEVIGTLRDFGNTHLHLDLIAGLPYEDLPSFHRSFNDVMRMKPHKLQLGFLKLLRGTALRAQADSYSIRYEPDAPYEVLETKWLEADDLFFLKDISRCVDLFYNEGIWEKTISWFTFLCKDSAAVFSNMAVFAREHGYLDRPLRQAAHPDFLYAFGRSIGSCRDVLQDTLAYDVLKERRNVPNSRCVRFDPWTAGEFQNEQIQAALAEKTRALPAAWFRKSRAQWFSFAIDRFTGEEAPRKEKNRLLFLYGDHTAVCRIRKG